MKVAEKKRFSLPKKKVKVRPILRARGMVKDPDHIAYFLMPNATITFSAPMDRSGNLICPLTEEEREYFEDKERSGLPFSRGDLSPYRDKEDNFWFSKAGKVVLGKNEVVLDLSNPYDYIKYKILLSNTDKIAPSWREAKDKATYIYAIVEEDQVIDDYVTKSAKLKKAYRYSQELENDIDAMIDFLTVYGRKPPKNAKRNFLISEIDKIIERNVDGFLNIIEDPLYKMKLFISKCVSKGLIKKSLGKYYLEGGDPLSAPGEINNLTNAAKFLSSKENQDIYATLKAKLESDKEKE